MEIFCAGINNGDGSTSVAFVESQLVIDLMSEFDPEAWGGAEGGTSFYCDNFSEEILTLEDAKEVLIQWGYATINEIEKWLVERN